MNGVNPILLWFWWGLTALVVIWYCTITVYVAVKGVFDIRGMLARLAGESETRFTPASGKNTIGE